MQYVHFQVGQVFTAGPLRVEEADILEFARRWDPQPFHTDPAAAAGSQWQGVIASGWHTCAIAMQLAVGAVLAGSTSCGSPGLEYLNWPCPVRPGDELALSMRVLELRESRSQHYGVVRWQWLLKNQHGDVVLDTIATSLFGL
jgi:acyl dehydratase